MLRPETQRAVRPAVPRSAGGLLQPTQKPTHWSDFRDARPQQMCSPHQLNLSSAGPGRLPSRRRAGRPAFVGMDDGIGFRRLVSGSCPLGGSLSAVKRVQQCCLVGAALLRESEIAGPVLRPANRLARAFRRLAAASWLRLGPHRLGCRPGQGSDRAQRARVSPESSAVVAIPSEGHLCRPGCCKAGLRESRGCREAPLHRIAAFAQSPFKPGRWSWRSTRETVAFNRDPQQPVAISSRSLCSGASTSNHRSRTAACSLT